MPPRSDPFAEPDEWIAAEARQLFRALAGYDPKAVEVALFYLTDFLPKALGGHLRAAGRWDAPGLWFDGLDAPAVDADPPARLRVRAWLVCVADGDREWWREPFELDLRLCPRTGRFRGCRYRVGDARPRGEKRLVGLEVGMSRRIVVDPLRVVELQPAAPDPVGGWLDEVIRGDFPGDESDAEPPSWPTDLTESEGPGSGRTPALTPRPAPPP